jgi:hypothetical protein
MVIVKTMRGGARVVNALKDLATEERRRQGSRKDARTRRDFLGSGRPIAFNYFLKECKDRIKPASA